MKKKWYLICRCWTEEFPFCGYLRNDGTWSTSMQIGRENGKDVYGYFDTYADAEKALVPWMFRVGKVVPVAVCSPPTPTHPNCRCVLNIKEDIDRESEQPSVAHSLFVCFGLFVFLLLISIVVALFLTRY